MSKTIVKRHSSQKSTRKTRSSLKTANLNRHKLSVFRSNKFIYAQIIDPLSGKSIAGVKGNNPEEVGAMMAEKSLKQGVKLVVFDRGSYRYHGNVKKLAESARKGGLDF